MNPKMKQTPVFRAVGMLLLLGGVQPLCQAQPEFASFKMTGAEGFVSVAFQTNGVVTNVPDSSNQGTSRISQRQTDLRFETSLMTHSYVYHPNLLALDFGLGVVAAWGRTDYDGIASSSRDRLYNVSAHASMFTDKPARGTVFFDRTHTAPTIDPGEIFNQTNTRYGVTAAVLAPLTPVPMDFALTREHNQGSSSLRVVDDQIGRFQFKAERALPNNGRTQFNYNSLRQISGSGSLNLPLSESQQDMKNLSLDTRLRFGTDLPHEINHRIDYSRQEYTHALGSTPVIRDLHVTLAYNGAINNQVRTFANYQFGRTLQNELATYSDAANAMATWSASKNLNMGAGAHLSDGRSPHFTSHAYGVDGSVNYSRDLALGSMQASYNVRYEKRNQTATDTQVAIVGERVALASTTTVALARKLVTSTSVLVQNATRSQTYVEGIDYALSLVGVTTRIQRLLSGNILDGEEVLVDYMFDVGGTYASSQTDQGLYLNWALSRLFSVYARVNSSTPRLDSGQPTSPLNTVRSRVVGARTDVPLSSRIDLVAGGMVERENHDETISPYVRTAGEAYLQGEFPMDMNNNYRFGARRSRITADSLLQESDLLGYDVQLGLRLNSGVSLNAIGLYERENAGAEPRVRATATLKALWRYRRLSFSADLSRIHESQGLYSRDNTIGRFDLRRDF